MNALRKSLAGAAVLVAGLLGTTTASATPYIIHMVQQGGNVVATGSGAIDLTGATYFGNGGSSSFLYPSLGFFSTGGSRDFYTGYTGPTSFGTGTLDNLSSFSGTFAEISGYNGLLFLPVGYSSGTNLSGTATWNSATFASLGVTPGTYVWSWGNGAEQSITLEIGAVSVPESSTLTLFGSGLLLMCAFVGLRRRYAA